MALTDLTPAEHRLVECARNGTIWDSLEATETEERTIRAEVLIALMSGSILPGHDAPTPLHPSGLRIRSAHIVNLLDFEGAELPVSLRMLQCYFDEPIDLTNARSRTLRFEACNIPGVYGGRLHAHGDVLLSWSVITGPVYLADAVIAGSIDAVGTVFATGIGGERENGVAVDLNGARVQGVVLFTETVCQGTIELRDAHIQSSVDADRSYILRLDATGAVNGYTLSLQNADVRGIVTAREASLIGPVRFSESALGGLSLDSSDVLCTDADGKPAGAAVVGYGAELAGGLDVDTCRFLGSVNLAMATIDGGIFASQTTFCGQMDENGIRTVAADLHGAVVRGIFDLTDSECIGLMRLDRIRIDFDLIAEGGSLTAGCDVHDTDMVALSGRGAWIGGDCYLNGLQVAGQVSLQDSEIGADFYISESALSRWTDGGDALVCDGAKIHGALFLRRSQFIGNARFYGITLGDNFDVTGSTFACPNTVGGPFGTALNFFNAHIGGVLRLTDMAAPPVGDIVLQNAYARVVSDDETLWELNGYLILDGFTYDRFEETYTTAAMRRDLWLLLQPPYHLKRDGKVAMSGFRPQPWTQLIRVLKTMGHEDDGRKIGIWREDWRRKSGSLSFLSATWNRFLGLTVGHGYQPWFAVSWSLAIVLIGALVFGAADRAGIMVPGEGDILTDEVFKRTAEPPTGYAGFNPFWYSLDVYLPVINLHQESKWLPGLEPGVTEADVSLFSANSFGITFSGLTAVKIFFWFQVIAGWILTSLAILAFTGTLRRD